MKGGGLFTNAAIGALLVVPAVTLQGPAAGSLEESLRRTLGALQALAGIEERLGQGDARAVEALLASTEPPLADVEAGDAQLVDLRDEVAALERELDLLHVGFPGHGSGVPAHDQASPATDAPVPVAPTTGLDEATRRLLFGAERAGPSGPTTPAPGATRAASAAGGARHSFEGEGYSADPLRLARAYYKKDRWLEALALLEGRSGPAEGYWRARCLEKLDRDAEAIAAYEQVIADPAGGWEAQRAREDLEFLRWRLEFEAKRAAASAARGQP